MINGVVRWFDDKKGYGFIESHGIDYFVHFKQIKQEGYKSLQQGDKVQFEAATSEKGKVAKDVSITQRAS